MSGGSWDYLYSRVADAASRLAADGDPKRASLAPHVERLADALHDIEWVDSGDYVPGDEHAAIDAFLAGLGVNADGCKVGGTPPVPGIGWGVRAIEEEWAYPVVAVRIVVQGWIALIATGDRTSTVDYLSCAALYRPGDAADAPYWRRE